MEKQAQLIQKKVASAFVHVSDLRRAAEWYSNLLDLPLIENRLNGGPVYWFDFQETGLILDSNVNNRENPQWREEMKPDFMLPVTDLDQAYTYLKDRATVFLEPEKHGEMGYFNFRDPEGNTIMACWEKSENPEWASTETNSPINAKISAVFVNVQDMAASTKWYTELFDWPLNEQETKESIYSIFFEKGAAMLLDDNRFRNGEDHKILFMFDTDDIDASYEYINKLNLEIFTELERHGSVAFFTIQDPDGNIIMVCSGV